jgi:DNA repair protein RecN (Recombination protein N)
MLTHLQISNFSLVDQLDLELNGGLSVLTGETGAGKSILLDAIGLVLGDRADADKIRQGCDKADIQATFNIDTQNYVRKWLDENELHADGECILRRVVTAEGRSRAFINGQSVTLQQLKTLGELLVNIHGQHEHQNLLKASTQRRLLDEYGNLRTLAKELKRSFYFWHAANERLQHVQEQSEELNARFQLLRYQVEELDQLELKEGELAALENEQKTLSNIEGILDSCQHIEQICGDEDQGIARNLQNALNLLAKLDGKSATLSNAETMLEQALINVQEAQNEIEHEQAQAQLDPNRLSEVEARLSHIYEIARKHKVTPEKLVECHQALLAELESLQSGDAQIDALEQEEREHREQYVKQAKKLSAERTKIAKKLTKAINEKLNQLAMSHAEFAIELAPHQSEEPQANGNEDIRFLISTIPGQAPKAIAKIASGGELSRISLAIQVVTAQTSSIQTLIFDEVDAGIGGQTGDIVGALLRELGDSGQVLCVTHLAQVASNAHHHLLVEKRIHKKGVDSTLSTLDAEARVLEVARMMGGAIDSAQSLAHAREMLERV